MVLAQKWWVLTPILRGVSSAHKIVSVGNKYHTSNKIFRNTQTIKKGDEGVVRGFLVNTLHYMEKRLEVRHHRLHGWGDLSLCVEKKCICMVAHVLLESAISQDSQDLTRNYEMTEHKTLSITVPLSSRASTSTNSKRRFEEESYVLKLV